jgi:coenzyme PQQ biosynthesis protein PqqD
VIAKDARPKLATKARLRYDRHGQRYMLLYPDRGMVLNPSAAAIVQLCTGVNTLDEIVAALCTGDGEHARAQVERDVRTFLEALLERALIRWAD